MKKENQNAAKELAAMKAKYAELLEKSSNSGKKSLYAYPKHINTFELKFLERKKLRSKLKGYCKEIISAYVRNNKDELNTVINGFISHYKKWYLMNDFTVGSITSSKKNASTVNDVLEIIKKTKKS